MSKYYLTTPIYYINDQPHIGNAYTTIAADVLARFHRQHGDEVLFLTGTDENSQKTVQAAEKAGQKDLAKYSDTMVQRWLSAWSGLNISYDRFIRTTEAGHKAAVYELLKHIQAAGDIEKGTYEGLYCVGCEEFKREEDLKDGHCLLHPKLKVEKIKEENYFFKLSRYQDKLLEYYDRHKDFIQPESRRNEVMAFVKRGLEDISVSRASQKWGIPFPGDETQVVYVWFDALINYLSGAGYPAKDYSKWWPANIHLVGKDIIKFHCIIWPAMLMSAGLRLPETIFAHGFFTVDGTKMSKSLGNTIDPVVQAKEYGVDALRYFLLREIPFGADGDFSHDRFQVVYDTELANELGNLVQRTASMVTRYLDGQVDEKFEHSHDIQTYYDAMAELHFDRALSEVWSMVRGLNQMIEEEKPWQLAKTDTDQLRTLLTHLVADLNLIATLLLPFMPETAGKIQKTFAGGKVDSSIGILFPRADTITRSEMKLPE